MPRTVVVREKELDVYEIFKKSREYIKKPIPIRAVQINDIFKVHTLEGVMTAAPGDYLVEGIRGELYPVDKEIFEASYEAI